MNHLNSVIVEGNLVRDPELGYTPKGIAVCRFTIASNRYYKQEDDYNREVSFFDVTAWARLGEVCSEYLEKGRGVRVVGRLKQNRWETTEGKNRSRVFIVAEHVEFKPKVRTDSSVDRDDVEEEKAIEEQREEIEEFEDVAVSEI